VSGASETSKQGLFAHRPERTLSILPGTRRPQVSPLVDAAALRGDQAGARWLGAWLLLLSLLVCLSFLVSGWQTPLLSTASRFQHSCPVFLRSRTFLFLLFGRWTALVWPPRCIVKTRQERCLVPAPWRFGLESSLFYSILVAHGPLVDTARRSSGTFHGCAVSSFLPLLIILPSFRSYSIHFAFIRIVFTRILLV
jgi:hypothetical protein